MVIALPLRNEKLTWESFKKDPSQLDSRRDISIEEISKDFYSVGEEEKDSSAGTDYENLSDYWDEDFDGGFNAWKEDYDYPPPSEETLHRMQYGTPREYFETNPYGQSLPFEPTPAEKKRMEEKTKKNLEKMHKYTK